MINAKNFKKFELVLDPVYPPVVPVRLHFFPFIKRVSPELTLIIEVIRRDSCKCLEISTLVDLEKIPVTPSVGGVRGYING